MGKKAKMSFKGIDWTELLPVFFTEEQIGQLREMDENAMEFEIEDQKEPIGDFFKAAAIHQRLGFLTAGAATGALNKKGHQTILELRAFLKALTERAEQITYQHHVFRGLSKTKDDETFLQFFNHLLEFMWV